MPNWRPLCQSLILIVAIAGVGLVASGNTSAIKKAQPTKVGLQNSPDSNKTADVVLGFKEWKSGKVSAAISEIVRLRRVAAGQGQLDSGPEGAADSGSKSLKSLKAQPLSSDLRAQLNQAKINLDVVRDLSVTDYFALYLAHQSDRKEAFAQAAKKLDDSELTEILLAYDKQLRQSDNRIAGP